MSTDPIRRIAEHALVVLAARPDIGPEYIAQKLEQVSGLDGWQTLRWLGTLDRTASAELAGRLRCQPADLDAMIRAIGDMRVRELAPSERELIGLDAAHAHPGM